MTEAAGFRLFDAAPKTDLDGEDELPKDEAGRAKIKQQYIELLGIRVNKLVGQILNRERINKTLEGIYFICARCQRVCHNLDDGLVEDEDNKNNRCVACDKAMKAKPRAVGTSKPAARMRKPAPKASSSPSKKKKTPKASASGSKSRTTVKKSATAKKTASSGVKTSGSRKSKSS